MNVVKELISSRELLANLTRREIKGKYKRTLLGQLWSLANPLALMLIYTFVFAFIIRVTPEPGDPSGVDVFSLWLLCGLLPWVFFSTVLNMSANSLVANANLIQKVYFPRIVLPVSVVAATTYNWLFEMALICVALLIAGSALLPWLPLVIVAMALLAVFATGVGLVLAIANVYFRDTQYFITIALQIWMYLSPIIYPITQVESVSKTKGDVVLGLSIADIYALNPMVPFLELFRNLMYDNRLPGLGTWIICLVWALGALIVGVAVFKRHEKRLAEAL